MPRKRKSLDETLGLTEVAEALEVARQGDLESLPQLRKVLNRTPSLWQAAGDLVHHAEEAWIKLIAGSDVPLAESLRARLTEMKQELGGDKPSPLEKLLVEQLGICWLAATYSDFAYANNPECSLTQAKFLLQRQRIHHERLVGAAKALAQVRKLLPGGKAARQHPLDRIPRPGRLPAKEKIPSAAAAARSTAPAVTAPSPKAASEECREGDS